MDKSTKDGFWFGILLSFFIAFSVLTFIALGTALGPDSGLQVFVVLFLLGDGLAFVIGLCVPDLFWKK